MDWHGKCEKMGHEPKSAPLPARIETTAQTEEQTIINDDIPTLLTEKYARHSRILV